MTLTNASHWAQGNNWSFMGVHRQVHFLPNMHIQCCMIPQGTLCGNFGIFAASGESTACVLLRKTSSRPIGVRVQEEIILIIHPRQLILSLMILTFRLVLVNLPHLLDLLDRQVFLACHQDGLQLHHLLVVEKEWEQEMLCVSDCIRSLHRLRFNLFQYQ